jgi:hypothetical protein
MVTDELMSTVFTAVILFAVAFFLISGYVRTMAMGAIDAYCHYSV